MCRPNEKKVLVDPAWFLNPEGDEGFVVRYLRDGTPIRRPDEPRSTVVAVDRCLVDEILWLNGQGIQTLGCCCGHGGLVPAGWPKPYPPYIAVGPGGILSMRAEDVRLHRDLWDQKHHAMRALGYEEIHYWNGTFHPRGTGTYYPQWRTPAMSRLIAADKARRPPKPSRLVVNWR